MKITIQLEIEEAADLPELDETGAQITGFHSGSVGGTEL
jgi:hypothetical protein